MPLQAAWIFENECPSRSGAWGDGGPLGDAGTAYEKILGPAPVGVTASRLGWVAVSVWIEAGSAVRKDAAVERIELRRPP